MSLFKRNKWYWMDDVVNGIRYRLPLKTTNWQEAKRLEKEKLSEIAEGKAGTQGPAARRSFNVAMDAYLEERNCTSPPAPIRRTFSGPSRFAPSLAKPACEESVPTPSLSFRPCERSRCVRPNHQHGSRLTASSNEAKQAVAEDCRGCGQPARTAKASPCSHCQRKTEF